MTQTVEGDVLRDACLLEPALQVIAHDALGEVLEHLAFTLLTAQLHCLVADRQELHLLQCSAVSCAVAR